MTYKKFELLMSAAVGFLVMALGLTMVMPAWVRGMGTTVKTRPFGKQLFTQVLRGGKMRKTLLFLTTSFILTLSLLTSGSALAYYWPPDNVPPGPPPNYNQVDTTYFKGSPLIPLPPPEDSGGLYVYYDQGEWCVANHIYSPGNSLEQFHCCVLAVMSQPPTLGVNVFIEEFELWADSPSDPCLKQNDRWGWIPWGDSLYEIWWDVTTREWKQGAGDPNDFMCFKIAGCAIDFNFWSSGHGEQPFGPGQIYLGENKIPLDSVPGFTDLDSINDPYQSQAGSDPTTDPNITIFAFKSDTLRSYNKNGLIDSTDSYSCDLALQYGQRYAGTFAYEGDGVEFSTSSLCPPNHDPNISITPDTTVFVCVGDSVCLWIYASDPDAEDTITVEKVLGIGTYIPITDITPISDTFCFYPDTSGTYEFIFKVTDMHGATGYDTTHITVNLNQPPEITCPDNDTVQSGHYLSGDFTVDDADGDSVISVDPWVDPSGTGITGLSVHGGTGAVQTTGHVEFDADSMYPGDYTIYLAATSGCGLKDTCSFSVTIPAQPPVITSTPDTLAYVGYLYTYDVEATGIPSPTFGLITFPTGMTIDSTTGLIEWTPAAVGDSDVCVEAINSAGADTQCFTITVVEPPQVSILPESLFIECGHEDTLWIHVDEKVMDMDSAFFKIAYEDSFITPDTVIKGPALAPPADFELYHTVYPDSILIGLAVLSGTFDGPGKILGIVLRAGDDVVGSTSLSIERSSLRNSGGQEIPHNTTGAEIVIDCQTSVDGEDEDNSQGPSVYALDQNYPNPYNPQTQIAFQLPQAGVVSLRVYNIKGQLVRTLVDGYKPAGTHTVTWDGKNENGINVSSGIYFYRIQAGKFTDTKKMVIIK